jgi:hypothetical protein
VLAEGEALDAGVQAAPIAGAARRAAADAEVALAARSLPPEEREAVGLVGVPQRVRRRRSCRRRLDFLGHLLAPLHGFGVTPNVIACRMLRQSVPMNGSDKRIRRD